ncbi:DedA family protein [Clostridium sp.]|uniref:DedA family protein n=1 Tax=Clostridium sp. TaxID=1506 RepID=UPI002FC81BF5
MNIIALILNIAMSITDKFGYIGVVIVMLLDYGCIPIPTEIIIPLIGCGVAEGKYKFIYAILFAVIGGTIGSLVSYTIGYYGGEPIINWIQKKFKSSKKGFDLIHKLFEKYGKIVVLICRIIPLTRIYVSLIAGAERINKLQFAAYSAIGIAIWTTGMEALGYYLGHDIALIAHLIARFSIAISIISIIGVIIFIKYKKRKV